MQRHPLLLALATLFVPFVWSNAAHAQLALTIEQIGEREFNTTENKFANANDCDSGSIITLTFPRSSLTDTTINKVDLWLGTASCQAADARNPSSTSVSCDHIASVDFLEEDSLGIIEIPMSQIEASSSLVDFCENTGSVGVDYQLFAIFTNTANVITELSDEQTAEVTLRVDIQPPSQPSIDAGPYQGDSQVTLTWEPNTDDTLDYSVYSGGSCDAPSLGAAIDENIGVGSRSANVNPTADLGLEVGEEAAVYVLAIDLAGNESVATEAICISRIEVANFSDVYGAMGGDTAECSEGGCSVGWADKRSAASILAFMALGLVWRRRR